MSDVTRILNAIEQGDAQATEELLPVVYEELRLLAAQKLSQETPGQTLQATALVHEAYLRIVDAEAQNWKSNILMRFMSRLGARSPKIQGAPRIEIVAISKPDGRVEMEPDVVVLLRS